MLDCIRRSDGPITGIIHGAARYWPGRFESNHPEKVRKTVLPKVDGALGLMLLTREDPIRWFIAYGSMGGRFGGNGLSDYAAASDMLAKLVDWYRRRRPECMAVCCQWQTWGEVGMVTTADELAINKSRLAMDFIPPAEGIDHLHQELRAGAPEGEVLLCDGHFQKLFYAAEHAKTHAFAPLRSVPRRPARPRHPRRPACGR